MFYLKFFVYLFLLGTMTVCSRCSYVTVETTTPYDEYIEKYALCMHCLFFQCEKCHCEVDRREVESAAHWERLRSAAFCNDCYVIEPRTCAVCMEKHTLFYDPCECCSQEMCEMCATKWYETSNLCPYCHTWCGEKSETCLQLPGFDGDDLESTLILEP